MVRVLQTQFAPLAEALCKGVFDLSQRGEPATLDSLTVELMRTYPGMEKPSSDIIYKYVMINHLNEYIMFPSKISSTNDHIYYSINIFESLSKQNKVQLD